MQYSKATLVLAALAIGEAVAGPFRHSHFHHKKNAAEQLEAYVDMQPNWRLFQLRSGSSVVDKRTPDDYSSTAILSTLSTADSSKLTSMGFAATGLNSVVDNGKVWIGGGGPYTNTFTNSAGEGLILVIWGPDGSWVNAVQPLVTLSLASGASQEISFASGAIGAWSAIYSDTEISNGQISNTWGEFTMSIEGVVNVSREVNMNGHSMSVVGPSCTTNMNMCVFVCSSGTVCMTDYLLRNCENGSQPGAVYGMYGGFPSGGCGGLGSSASLTTTFS